MEEKIKNKITELQETREQLLSRLNAVIGAIQALTGLLEGDENEENTD